MTSQPRTFRRPTHKPHVRKLPHGNWMVAHPDNPWWNTTEKCSWYSYHDSLLDALRFTTKQESRQ